MKNKRVLVTSILILLVLFVAGASYLKFRNNSNQLGNNTTVDKSVFTSIKNALNQKLTLTCEFTDEYGNATKSYIKGGVVRVSMTGDDKQAGEIIINNKKMYMWDDKKKEGFVYTIPDEPEDSQTGVTSQDIVSSEVYLDTIEKYKDSCKVATLDDSFFTPPSDVKFQDMSKFLEDLKSQMPQGYELPNQ